MTGKRLVADVVLNRVEPGSFPDSIVGDHYFCTISVAEAEE